MMNTYLRGVWVFVLLVMPVSLRAHRSQALARYDADHPATLNRTVVEGRHHVTIVGALAKDDANEIGLLHESRITNTDTGTVVYDARRPVWLLSPLM
jgi:hypothetical protein